MVTQKHKFYKKNQHDSFPQQQSEQFRWHNATWIWRLSTLFSWVVFKNTAIEAETKRNRKANETSAIKQILPQRKKQKYHQNRQQTLIQRNQSSGYQESLKEPPTRAQSKVFYLTSTSVNHISPGTKKPGSRRSQKLRNTYVSKAHHLFDL